MTWPIVPLGDVADTALGKMLDKGKPKGHPKVPYLRNVNVQWGQIDTHDLLTMELANEDRDRFAVQKGDLLVCEGGEIGRCAIWQGRDEYLAYQKALHRVRPGDQLDARFLRYVLESCSLNGTLAGLATGSTIAHLPQQQLRRVPVPLPPLDEQCRIVDILEDHLSRLDAAVKELAATQVKLDALYLSTLVSARKELVDCPSSQIGKIADTALGKMLDSKRQSGESTPYLRNINVRWGSFELTDIKTTLLSTDEIQKLRIRDGDLMVCEGGEPGRCAVWRDREHGLAYQKALHRVRVHDPSVVVPEFVELMLSEGIRTGRHDQLFTGTTIKHLPQIRLRQIEIPLPDVAEQRRLLARCKEMSDSRINLEARLHAAQARAAALRRSLLSAAFSGYLPMESG